MKAKFRSLGLLFVLLAAPTLADQQADCINCRKEALKAQQICLLQATNDAQKLDCQKAMFASVKSCEQGACNY